MSESSRNVAREVATKVKPAIAEYMAAAGVNCRARKVFNNLWCRIMRLVQISVFAFVKGELIQQELPRPSRSGSCCVRVEKFGKRVKEPLFVIIARNR